MKTFLSILLIMVFAQTTVSVRAEQDVTVTAVMNGSTMIGGQKIKYPKTDKAEMASVPGTTLPTTALPSQHA